MIYLLPVSHDVQFNQHSLSGELKEYLIKLVKEKNIEVICEEANENMMRYSSIPLQVSAECVVSYIPCEPNNEEAKKLGILPPNWPEILAENIAKEMVKTGSLPIKILKEMDNELAKSNNIREKYWLGKIQEHKKLNIVFILGIGHLSSDTHGVGDNYSKLVYGKESIKLTEGFDTLLEVNDFNIEVLPKQFVNPKYK